jgi:hypothetical protein
VERAHKLYLEKNSEISKARQLLNKDTLVQLYYSFLYPFITYCNIIWGNAPASHLNQYLNYKNEPFVSYAIFEDGTQLQ